MALHVVTGPANSGKTGRAHGLIRDAMKTGRDAWLVLPTQLDVERATKELAPECPIGLRVGTFHAHLSHVWSLKGDGRALITEAQRSLLLSSAAGRCHAGASMTLLANRCIEQLADQGGDRWRAGMHRSHAVADPLAEIIEMYGADLARLGLIEPAEALHLMGSDPDVSADVLVVHRFSGLTEAQMAYLRGASLHSDVWVTLVWEEGFAPTTASGRVLEALSPDEVLAEHGDTFHTSAALGVLADRLFDVKAVASATVAPRDGSVRFVLAEGAEAQARAVAGEVAKALAEGAAARAGDVAVIMRRPEPHLSYLRRAFRVAGIEASWSLPVRFASTVFGGAVLDVLDYAQGMGRAPLERLLRSPFSGCAPDSARRIELGWRKGGSGRPSVIRDLEASSPHLASVLAAATSAARADLNPDSCAALAGALRQLFGLGCCEPAHCASAEDSHAFSAVIAWLSDAALLCEGRVGVSDMRRALGEWTVAGTSHERPERVHVTSAMAVRGRRFGTVILVGLNAGDFPGEPDEIMTSAGAVGRLLAANGVRVDGQDHQAAEQMLFYEVITRARTRLVLIGRSSDDDGEALALSPFWHEAADALGLRRGESDTSDEYVTSTTGEQESGRQRLRAGVRNQPVPHACRARARALGASRQLRAAPTGEVFDREFVSPSEVEAYARCPYRWFVDYALRPAELDQEWGAREQGEYAHRLLAGAYRMLGDAGNLPLPSNNDQLREEALSSAAQDLETSTAALSFIERLGRARATDWARRILREDAARESAFVPTQFEWAFNGEECGLVLEGVALRGRVDRVDVDDQGRAIVVDYKRRVDASVQAAKLVSHAHLQGLLYAEAIRRSLGLSPAGALYRGLSRVQQRGVLLKDADYGDGTTRTDRRAQHELEEMIQGALSAAASAVAKMRAGEIEPNPASAHVCTYCSAAAGCSGRLQ